MLVVIFAAKHRRNHATIGVVKKVTCSTCYSFLLIIYYTIHRAGGKIYHHSNRINWSRKESHLFDVLFILAHRDLRVGKQYHYEAPWPSAQAELGQLAAFKTPKDKVACVVRCCQTIMNLLSLSAKSSVPAADDFLPVLVFVIVKANPPSALSTVQYVESFYGNRVSGEDHYWWMQFVAAIEFIKTMDYSNC